MTPEKRLDIEEVLSTLDKRSSTARTVSISLTLVSVLILAAVLFLTYRTTSKLLDTSQKLANTNNELVSAADRLANMKNEANVLRDEKEKLLASIDEAKKSLSPGAPNIMKARQVLENAQINVPGNIKPVTPPDRPGRSTAKVFIHIADESQRREAKLLAEKLGDGKFKVQGVELIKRGMKQTEIRYFYPDDKEMAAELAAKLNAAGISSILVFTRGAAENGQLEIWLANHVFLRIPAIHKPATH